jgi:hypothetical protein
LVGAALGERFGFGGVGNPPAPVREAEGFSAPIGVGSVVGFGIEETVELAGVVGVVCARVASGGFDRVVSDTGVGIDGFKALAFTLGLVGVVAGDAAVPAKGTGGFGALIVGFGKAIPLPGGVGD